MKLTYKILIGFALFGVIALLAALNLWRANQEEVFMVKTAQVKEEKMEAAVFASGKVKLVDRSEVYAIIGGKVEQVLVEEGELVKPGQALAILETRELEKRVQQAEASLELERASYDKTMAGARPQEIEQAKIRLRQAEAAVEVAQRNLERVEGLVAEGVSPAKDLEAARVELAKAESQLDTAKQDLSLVEAGETAEAIRVLEARLRQAELTLALAREELQAASVVAPVAGTVLKVSIEPGEMVTTGKTLFSIGDLGRMELVAEAMEADSGRLAVGQPVRITTRALPDEQLPGIVERIAPQAQTVVKNQQGEQVMVAVTIKIQEGRDVLKPGYNADATIVTDSKESALVVPHEAVVEKDGKKHVFVVEDGRAKKVEVITGIGNELFVEITGGLQKDQAVVINPPEKLQDGSRVKARDEAKDKGNKGKSDD